MIAETCIDVIESCLHAEFPGYAIEGNHANEGGYLFRISSGDQRHVLYIDTDADNGKDAEALKSFFYDCNVPSVLRHVGDFTVSLTDSGCIFGNP